MSTLGANTSPLVVVDGQKLRLETAGGGGDGLLMVKPVSDSVLSWMTSGRPFLVAGARPDAAPARLASTLQDMKLCTGRDLQIVASIARRTAACDAREVPKIRALEKGLTAQGVTMKDNFPLAVCYPYLQSSGKRDWRHVAVIAMSDQRQWLSLPFRVGNIDSEVRDNTQQGCFFMFLAMGGNIAKWGK
ncbi:MAG: hypothetical protein EOO40_12255 [Deltaproteobacteria bacterium]|nr:MAG: hypothetical protein EOO40_12255 [Deltaproteobacteria bacterium]